MHFFRFLRRCAVVAGLALSMPAMAANILEIDDGNDTFDGPNVFTLLDGDFGIDDVPGSLDFWKQVDVKQGHYVFAATVTAGASTLRVIDHDGSTVVENLSPPADEAEDGVDAGNGLDAGAAIAGLRVNTPGNLYFEVSDAGNYELCTVVARQSDVGFESEIIQNDLASNATLYSNTVMFGELDDVDFYKFQAVKGMRLMVILDSDPDGDGDAEPLIEILQEDETPLASSENPPPQGDGHAYATGIAEIVKTGKHYVKISDPNDADGDYSFVICGLQEEAPESEFTGVIGDYVWWDKNRDGIQDIDEAGIKGIKVQLLDENFNLLLQTKTNGKGKYKFVGLPNGTYYVKVLNPPGSVITGKDLGGDDKLDSDADPMTGITDQVIVAGGVGSKDADIGLYPDILLADKCPPAPPATDNESALKAKALHSGFSKLKFVGKKATIAPSVLDMPGEVKLCVYYDGALGAEAYIDDLDPGLVYDNGVLKYKGNGNNVTGLRKLKIKSGTFNAKYGVVAKQLSTAPAPAVMSTVEVFIITDEVTLSESFSVVSGQVKQIGNKVKAKKK